MRKRLDLRSGQVALSRSGRSGSADHAPAPPPRPAFSDGLAGGTASVPAEAPAPTGAAGRGHRFGRCGRCRDHAEPTARRQAGGLGDRDSRNVLIGGSVSVAGPSSRRSPRLTGPWRSRSAGASRWLTVARATRVHGQGRYRSASGRARPAPSSCACSCPGPAGIPRPADALGRSTSTGKASRRGTAGAVRSRAAGS